MSTEPSFMTRRSFLRTGVIGGALATTLPSFLDQTLFKLEAAERNSPLQRGHGRDAPILILLQLAGGNDGLNTVIPLENDHYRRARPRLSSVESTAHRLTDDIGLHESLSGFKSLYDDGSLAILNGVGYPNPNRSHFRSTEIWHTGQPEGRNGEDGWMGRYFDNQCKGMPAETAISLTATPPQAFQGPGPMGITFRNPNQFRFEDGSESMAGASIGDSTGRGRRQEASPLHFLERTDLDARVSSDTLHQILKKTPQVKNFPRSGIANDLTLIARLIGGGMSTRIYYLSQGGYDTHANQMNSHARLLRELGDAQQAFWSEMKRQGNSERVRMLVFSEFGRRVDENGSSGTDHGAAAPVFVLGGGIRAGLHGEIPSLDPKDLERGDLAHQIDFRQVYASLLQQHLNTNASTILGQSWNLLKL
ncbi:MAG: DUF1501 domain-containing protein [Kiritimatiellae bacterium]|jgi:uncharacterized protein (DUF1501 family)|nr:DUF1501 domain-containing protein [Kiritimatiellia bacterium]